MGINKQKDKTLSGQVAIVTGGAGGIGQATCFELARLDARVVIVDLDSKRVDDVVQALKSEGFGDDVLGIAASVQSETEMEDMVLKVIDRFGRIDILVHGVGILRAKESGLRFLHQTSVDDWNVVIDTNLKGTFLSNRAVLPTMVKQGAGHIINISSTSGLKGRAYDSAYCASKFGMIGLAEALAEEVRSYGIRIHTILPDAVDTPIWKQNGPVQAPNDALSPDRVANLIGFLVTLPADTILDNIIIRPFKGRRKRKAARNE